jgi:hypothetical protein
MLEALGADFRNICFGMLRRQALSGSPKTLVATPQ